MLCCNPGHLRAAALETADPPCRCREATSGRRSILGKLGGDARGLAERRRPGPNIVEVRARRNLDAGERGDRIVGGCPDTPFRIHPAAQVPPLAVGPAGSRWAESERSLTESSSTESHAGRPGVRAWASQASSCSLARSQASRSSRARMRRWPRHVDLRPHDRLGQTEHPCTFATLGPPRVHALGEVSAPVPGSRDPRCPSSAHPSSLGDQDVTGCDRRELHRLCTLAAVQRRGAGRPDRYVGGKYLEAASCGTETASSAGGG